MTGNALHSEDNLRQLRHAFGSFATGVTVVTTLNEDGRPIGFTANSFTSVSMDPPLLLVCLAKSSSNIRNFTLAKRFAVNILSETQKNISNRFASRQQDRFVETPWREGIEGTPLIDDAVAWFDCASDNVVDAGDHIILIGQITDFGQSDQRPLAYLRGHYLDLGLAEDAADSVSHHGGVRVGCVLECMGQVLLDKTPDGWTLPMGEVCAGFREGRAALEKSLAEQGIAAEMGFLYSVFDAPSGNATWLIFQGEMEHGALLANQHLFSVQDLPLQEVAVPQVRSILRRFQSEYRQARFGLYVDDARSSGQINTIDRSATKWTKFITEQEEKS